MRPQGRAEQKLRQAQEEALDRQKAALLRKELRQLMLALPRKMPMGPWSGEMYEFARQYLEGGRVAGTTRK